MDLREYLKSRFQDYKAPSVDFGTSLNSKRRLSRAEAKNFARKARREEALLERRNIDKMEVQQPVETKTKKLDRLTRMKMWKKEKEERLKQEKLNRKPIFKIGACASRGFPQVKDTEKTQKSKNVQKSFAPNNFEFKAPKNIEPINIVRNKPTAKNLKFDLNIAKSKPEPKKNTFNRVTRSQKPVASPPLPLPVRKITKKILPKNDEKNIEKITKPIEQKILTDKIATTLNVNDKDDLTIVKKSPLVRQEALDISNSENTPPNISKTPEYISPFVTTSRGKGSIKKENRERQSRGLPKYTKHVTSDSEINSKIQEAGTIYFYKVLDSEITRLSDRCAVWNTYKSSEEIPEDCTDMIDVAVGQSNLLINKKFQQFRGLINNCQNGGGDKPVTCEDLQGFWDMIYMQVENLDKRFARLEEMKANDWEEIKVLEVKKPAAKKRAPLVRQTKSVATSNIRAAIQAARKKALQTQSADNPEPVKEETAKQDTTENVFNGGFFIVRSPQKNTPNTRSRKSLLVSVLSTEANRRQRNSNSRTPGAAMMKVSQTAKSVETKSELLLPTPGKSILKNSGSKPTIEHLNSSVKTVLFKESDSEEEVEELKTMNTTLNLTESNTPKNDKRRRSVRLNEKTHLK